MKPNGIETWKEKKKENECCGSPNVRKFGVSFEFRSAPQTATSANGTCHQLGSIPVEWLLLFTVEIPVFLNLSDLWFFDSYPGLCKAMNLVNFAKYLDQLISNF